MLERALTAVDVRQFAFEDPEAQSEPGTMTVLARVVVPLGQPEPSSFTANVTVFVVFAATDKAGHTTDEPDSAPPPLADVNEPWASRAAIGSLIVTPDASPLPVFCTVIV